MSILTRRRLRSRHNCSRWRARAAQNGPLASMPGGNADVDRQAQGSQARGGRLVKSRPRVRVSGGYSTRPSEHRRPRARAGCEARPASSPSSVTAGWSSTLRRSTICGTRTGQR
jgi:hypothetical protein